MQSLGVSVTFLESFIRESLTVIRPKTEEGSQPVLSEAASLNEPRDQGVKEPVHMNMFELIEKVVKPQTATKQSRFVELHHGKVSFSSENNFQYPSSFSDSCAATLTSS